MEFKILGKLLIATGIIFVLIGLFFISNIKIPWLGKLPGDISIHRENFSFYFPITTCIILSIILSLILWMLFRR